MVIEIEFPEIEGEYFPKEYTCDGENISPHIKWTKVDCKAYALLMDDPDAPMGIFTHWMIYNIEDNELPKGVPRNFSKAKQLRNDFGKIGYDGPCPPKGHGIHHYHFKVFALSEKINVPISNRKEFLEAISKLTVDKGEKILLYKRD